MSEPGGSVSNGIDPYKEIASILLAVVPQDARVFIFTFIVRAEESPDEGAVYQYEFDYLDASGKTHWFDKECSHLMGSLTPLALQVRSEIDSKGKAKWKSMKFHIDMKERSFKAEFSYD